MDRVRHLLAVLALVSYLPGLGFWFLIHPLVRTWRRVGPSLTYALVSSALAVVAVTAFRARGTLLGRDFGTNWTLVTIGGGWFAILVCVGFAFGRHAPHLNVATRMGMPELTGAGNGTALVREGAYQRVRHPIYSSASTAGVGYALIVNYLGIYILCLCAIPVLSVITLLEERELVDRFGEPYRRYQREVPRLLPRWKPARNDR